MNIKIKKVNIINYLFFVVALFFCPALCSSAWAQIPTQTPSEPTDSVSGQQVFCGSSVTGACLWAETDVSAEEIRVFDSSLSRLARTLPGFSLLPSRWNLWLSNHWWASAGYWSPTQMLSDGSPYLLLRRGTFQAERGAIRILAHELTHLIQYRLQPHAEDWIREGMALLSEYRMLRVPPSSIFAAQVSSAVQLTGPLSLELEGAEAALSGLSMIQLQPRYGAIFLYFHYVDRVCFSGTLLETLLAPGARTDAEFGLSEWDSFLRLNSSHALCRNGFRSSFRAFARARFAPDLSRPDGSVWTFSSLPAVSSSEQLAALPARAIYAATSNAQGSRCARGEEYLPASFASAAARCLRIHFPENR